VKKYRTRKRICQEDCNGHFIILALYLSVNYSYYKIIGFDELKTTRGIAAIVVEKMFGESGKYIFSVLLFLLCWLM
jgi:APA family basic amino acid/polyamine antiporter